MSKTRFLQVYGITRRRLTWTLMLTSLVSTLLCTHKYGAFWVNDAFKAGWNTLARGPDETRKRRFAFTRELVSEHLPDDAAVCASSSIGAQISNRESIKKWPAYYDADYLLLMESRFKSKSKRRLERLLRRGTFRLIDKQYGVSLYERVPDDEQADARREWREKNPKKGGKARKGKPSVRKRLGDDVRKRTADDDNGGTAPADAVDPPVGDEPSDDADDLDADAADRGPETED